MGAAWEVATEVGGGDIRLRKVLLRVSSGGAVVWGRDVGAIGTNGAEVRGSECGFPVTGNKLKGKAAQGRFVAEGGVKKSTSGSGDTATPYILGQEKGGSGGVGGPKAYF